MRHYVEMFKSPIVGTEYLVILGKLLFILGKLLVFIPGKLLVILGRVKEASLGSYKKMRDTRH